MIMKYTVKLSFAMAEESRKNQGIKYKKADIISLDFLGNNRFDIALLNFVLIETSPIKAGKIFHEARSILKKGGILIIGEKHPFCINKKTKTGGVFFTNKKNGYFNNGAKVTSTAFLTNGNKLSFPGCYHYRLDFLLNTLIENGFSIDFIRELSYKDKIPTNIVIVAKKV